MRHRSIVFRVLLFCAAWGSARAAVSVVVSANPPNLSAGQTSSLVATVQGATSNNAVTWTLTPQVGSLQNATGPTGIVSQITYKAPASVASAQSVTVTATSVEDPMW